MINGFPPLSAGEVDKFDKDHQAARLSEINLQRIKHTPEGGDRGSWPKELINDCLDKNYNGHKDVYGRLAWDKQAAGITTKCTSYSNGRFGHPDQNRAISLREAACLQTFPRNFKFSGSLANRAKQVGNAVPPLLAKHLGQAIIQQHKSQLVWDGLVWRPSLGQP